MSALDQLIAIVTGLGVDTDTISILKGTDEEKIKGIDPKVIITGIVDNQKTILESDDAFTGPIERKVRGELLGKRQELLLRTFKDYLTEEEVNALPERDRYDAAVKLLAKKVSEKKADPNDDKDKKILALAKEIEDRDNEIKKLKEEEIPAIETKFKSEREKELAESTVRGIFDKSFGTKTIIDASLIYPAINQKLLSTYDVKIENGEPVLYEKGKTTKALRNAKPLKLEDAFGDIQELKSALKKSEEPPKKESMKEGEPPKFKTIGSNEFAKRLAEKEAELKK